MRIVHLGLVLSLAFVVHCDSTICEPGLVRVCPCLGSGQGVQGCGADGQSWDSCLCPGADGDGDVDADVDGDIDGDHDGGDGDADGDADGDTDGELDGDVDAHTDGDLDGDFDDEPLERCTQDGMEAYCFDEDTIAACLHDEVHELVDCEAGEICSEFFRSESGSWTADCDLLPIERCVPNEYVGHCVGDFWQYCLGFTTTTRDCAAYMLDGRCGVVGGQARCYQDGTSACHRDPFSHIQPRRCEDEQLYIWCPGEWEQRETCGQDHFCLDNEMTGHGIYCMPNGAIESEEGALDQPTPLHCEGDDLFMGGYGYVWVKGCPPACANPSDPRTCTPQYCLTRLDQTPICAYEEAVACDPRTYENHCVGDVAYECRAAGYVEPEECGACYPPYGTCAGYYHLHCNPESFVSTCSHDGEQRFVCDDFKGLRTYVDAEPCPSCTEVDGVATCSP